MSMRDRLEVSTRGAPAEAVPHAGPGGSEGMAFPGAEMPEPVEISDPAWALVLGEGAEAEEQLGDLRHLQHLLKTYPQSESAMRLQALNLLRESLNLTGLDEDATTPKVVPCWLLVIASRALLRGL